MSEPSTRGPHGGHFGEIDLVAAIVDDSAELVDVDVACVGRHELFEPGPVGEDNDRRLDRRGAALELCAQCPALPLCGQWIARQSRSRWLGWVVAGQYISR